MKICPLFSRANGIRQGTAVPRPGATGTAWCVGLALICTFARVGLADKYGPVTFLETTANTVKQTYERSYFVPAFPLSYARLNPGESRITLTYYGTVSRTYPAGTPAGVTYTITATPSFSLNFDGACQGPGRLNLADQKSFTTTRGGTLSSSSHDEVWRSLPLVAPSKAGFTSNATTPDPADCTLTTYGKVSVTYDYTPIGLNQQDPIPLDKVVNNRYVLDAAPSGRWYSSPPAGGGVRSEIASADGAMTAVALPTDDAGSFRVVADGQDYGVHAGGTSVTFAAGAKAVAVSRVNAAGGQTGPTAFPLAFTFSQGTVDLAVSSLTRSEAWRVGYFGTTENSGAAADAANPAGDGLNNLLKYALNLNPLVPTPNPVVVDVSTGALRLTAPRNPQATDVTLSVQVASDPAASAAWTASGVTVDQNTATLLQAHDNTPIASANRRFIRLQVIRP